MIATITPIICAAIAGAVSIYGIKAGKKLREVQEQLARRTTRLVVALKDCRSLVEVENHHCGTENFNANKNVGRRAAARKTGREISEQCQPAALRKLIERYEEQ